MEFSRQEYWSGLTFPSSGDLPNPGIEPRSPSLQATEVTDISPGNLDSSLCFIQPSVWHVVLCIQGFPGGSEGKASACNVGDMGSIPGSGRSPGEGNGNPLQYSCLENSMDRGAWWATVHGVAKTEQLHFSFTFHLFTQMFCKHFRL